MLSYSKAFIFGVASIMQLLALFGVATEINESVWVIGAAYLNFLVVMIYLAMEFVVWNSLRSKVDSSAEAKSAIAIVRKEFWLLVFSEAVSASTLRFHYRSWRESNTVEEVIDEG